MFDVSAYPKCFMILEPTKYFVNLSQQAVRIRVSHTLQHIKVFMFIKLWRARIRPDTMKTVAHIRWHAN